MSELCIFVLPLFDSCLTYDGKAKTSNDNWTKQATWRSYARAYAEGLPFHGHGDQIHFEKEGEIADEQLLGESDEGEPEDIVDEIIDTDISKDESESNDDDVVLPRKFSCQKDLLDDSKYEKPPDQQSRTFVWTNKGRYCLEWTTKELSAENNTRNAGRLMMEFDDYW